MNQFKSSARNELAKSEVIEFYKIASRIVGSLWTEDEGAAFFKRVVKQMNGIQKY